VTVLTWTQPIVCTWSGGKDSCLAMHRAVRDGATPTCLVTMCIESGERTRNHGLSRAVIEAQAAAMGVPVMTAACSWARYEACMIDVLRASRSLGATAAVFGDIDIERHREWEHMVCDAAGLTPRLPLWQSDRRALLAELFAEGYAARIVTVRDGMLDPSFLGRTLTPSLVDELESAGIDACGENGEFHTVVVDGPMFNRPVHLRAGRTVLLDGCWFMDFDVITE